MNIKRINNVNFRGSFDPSKPTESPSEKTASQLVDSVENRADEITKKMLALDNLESWVGAPEGFAFDPKVGDSDPREGYVRLERFSATPGHSTFTGTLTPTSLEAYTRTENNESLSGFNGTEEKIHRKTENGITAEAYHSSVVQNGSFLADEIHYRSDFNGVISVEEGHNY